MALITRPQLPNSSALSALLAVASFAAAVVFFRVVERRFLNNAG